MGDHIITEAAYNQLKFLLDGAFLYEVSTHLPVSKRLNSVKDFDYRFVFGSNLLRGKMNRRFRQWDINILNANKIGSCILVGAGWWQYGDDPNYYTKKLYEKVLTRNFYHSVRDSYTEKQLKKIGFKNVLNTACPSMWQLNEEHCSKIPESKSEDVVCTINNFKKNLWQYKNMIEILQDNYKNIYLWLQGDKDYDCINKMFRLGLDNKAIKFISPSLEDYDCILQKNVDYVGTRLHGGIRALQKFKRTIIIGIDNRAIEKQKDFNIKCLPKDKIDELPNIINSRFSTEIKIPVENIRQWKSQF